MTIINIIRKLFGEKKSDSISEILDKMDMRDHVTTIGNRTFARLWLVKDMDNGFKTKADGFNTKAAAKAYCETVSFNWYIMPYEIELKGE